MKRFRKDKARIVGQIIIKADERTDKEALRVLLAETGLGTVPEGPSSQGVLPTPASDFMYDVEEDGTIRIFRYIGDSTDIIIPAVIDGRKVSDLGLAFASNIRKITLLEGYEHIYGEAMLLCRDLEEVVLPPGLKSIHEDAFRQCEKLERVNLPDSLESLSEGAFTHCYKLKEIELPLGLLHIEGNPFYGSPVRVRVPDGHPVFSSQDGVLFNHLSKTLVHYPSDDPRPSYTVPGDTKALGSSSFIDCSLLEKVILPEGLQAIGEYAFFSCDRLQVVMFPDSLRHIGTFAFGECESLSEVVLPEGLESLGDNAFYECKSLKRITLPEGLQSLGKQAFDKIEGLKVYVPLGSPAVKAVLDYNKRAEEAGEQPLNHILVRVGKARKRKPMLDAKEADSTGSQEKRQIQARNSGSLAEKLEHITQELLTRYVGQLPLTLSITRIANENPDLQVSSIQSWARAVHDETAAAYLKRVGILVQKRPTARDQYLKARVTLPADDTAAKAVEEKDLHGKTGQVGQLRGLPFQATQTHHWYQPEERHVVRPQVYEVPELDISGEAAKDWVLRRLTQPECYLLKDYKGSERRITLPASINGQRITAIDSFSFKDCRAEEVLIPGCYQEISKGMFDENTHLKSVTLGEGVETIEQFAFSKAVNLEEVKASASVDDVVVDHGLGLKDSRWFEQQGEYVVLGKMLLAYKGKGPLLKVPHGVEVVCQRVMERTGTVEVVVIPETVTTLRQYAFQVFVYQSRLSQLHIPPSVSTIEYGALGNNPWTQAFGEEPVIVNGILHRWDNDEDHLVIPEGVTGISSKLFMNKEIKSVSFPASLRKIGKLAFYRCAALESLSFSEGLTQIEAGAFAGCHRLTAVELPDSLVFLDKKAFLECGQLVSVRFGKGLRAIGERAFKDCKELSQVSLNEGLEGLGQEAFSDCRKLKTLALPDSLTTIGKRAFEGCSALEQVQLPQELEELAQGLFRNCKGLTMVQLPHHLRRIGAEAFKGCTSLQNIAWPLSLEEIGDGAFMECEALGQARLPGRIGKQAFMGCSGLKTLEFSPELRSIPDGAFARCPSLTSLVLPESIEEIGTRAFASCNSLRSVILPPYLKLLGDFAFGYCSSLMEVQLPERIGHQGERVFTRTPYQQKVHGDFTLEGTVLTDYQGQGQQVTIPEGVTEIADEAFVYFKEIKEVIIPDSVIKIGNSAFYPSVVNHEWCSMDTLQLGDGVRTIGVSAFANNERMRQITFGSALEKIGNGAFERNETIKQVLLSHTKLQRIGDRAFSYCESLEELTLPETLQHVGENAFEGCEQLKPFELPGQLQYVGREAFGEVAFDVVTLPKTMKRVERSAFTGARELIVYDTIEPDAVEAEQWEFDVLNGTVNAPLACAMLDMPTNYLECQGNAMWRDYHITVLSAQTDQVKYRIFCDGSEHYEYLALMFSAWGRYASFKFKEYDSFFERLSKAQTRIETAFCRLQFPQGLAAEHRETYESYLQQATYMERSAVLVAEAIAGKDNMDRLRLLMDNQAISQRNAVWMDAVFRKAKAKRCRNLLKQAGFE